LHGQVLLRIDRPNFPRPPLDEVITETVQRLIGLYRTKMSKAAHHCDPPDRSVGR
jgi:hypothetical protein